jgi:4a-hydroxytetrahydrobiopterin dehydratase
MRRLGVRFQRVLSAVGLIRWKGATVVSSSAMMAGGETFMAEQLADKKCVPCRGGVPPLKGKELDKLHKVVPQWTVIDEHHLAREFTFPDFAEALAFVNRVGAVAEEQGHHPDILLAWGKAEITLWTHKVNGLTESDFIMAAKINRLLPNKKKKKKSGAK